MAPLKDYYKTLDIPPQASLQEIKSSYRKLVMLYHPDHNEGDPYKAAHFSEVQEAYQVLSDPQKREHYHQQRWLYQGTGKKAEETQPVTPHQVLLQARRLEDEVSRMDIFRMNQHALAQQITALVSDTRISQLQPFNDPFSNQQIIMFLLQAAHPLSYAHAQTVAAQLRRLAINQPEELHTINKWLQQRKREHTWNLYKTPLLILVALLVCFIIYKMSN